MIMPTENKELSCECDVDCGGDPLRFFRCNNATLCPVHDECEVCNDALATAVIDGTKVCEACRQQDEADLRDGYLANQEEEMRVHADFEHVDAEAWRDIDKAL